MALAVVGLSRLGTQSWPGCASPAPHFHTHHCLCCPSPAIVTPCATSCRLLVLPGLRNRLRARSFSPDAEDFSSSRWLSTQRQYCSATHQWEEFCDSRGENHVSPSLESGISYLAPLAAAGKSYSAVNSSRSTLSAFPPSFGGHHFGAHS